MVDLKIIPLALQKQIQYFTRHYEKNVKKYIEIIIL